MIEPLRQGATVMRSLIFWCAVAALVVLAFALERCRFVVAL